MDKEKLIEARNEFFRENRSLIGNEGPLIADAFDAAWDAVMRLPLSERLTEEEKAKIIKMYKSDLVYARMYTKKMESATDPSSLQKATNEREVFASGVRMLKTIFGTDLFNDKSE